MSISDSATENSEINDDPTNIVTDTSTDSSTDTSADSVFSEDSSPIRTTCYGTAHPVDMSMYPGWEEPPVVQPRWHLFNFKLVRGFLGNKTTLGLGYLLALIAMQTAAIAMILEGVYLLWDSKGFMVVPITVGLLGVALGVYGGFVLFNYQISPMRIFLDLFTAFFSLQSIWLAAGFGVVVWQMLRTQVTYWHILTTLSMVMFNLPFAYFYMAFGECIFSAYVFNFRYLDVFDSLNPKFHRPPHCHSCKLDQCPGAEDPDHFCHSSRTRVAVSEAGPLNNASQTISEFDEEESSLYTSSFSTVDL